MYPSLESIASVEHARRREAERRAAQWRLVLSLPSQNKTWNPRPGLWRRIALLARVRDRRIVRARLREYAAR
jgi:hypothetical protein